MGERIGTTVRDIIIVLLLISSAMVVFGTNTATADPVPSVPGVPTGLMAVPGQNQVDLNWTSPASNGGATIWGFHVYQNGLKLNIGNIASTTIVISGLTNGETYIFSVAAYNSVGIGAQTSGVLATPNPIVGSPSVPIGLTAVRGNNIATLNWTAPVDEGSSAIDYYIIYEMVDNSEYDYPIEYAELLNHLTGLTAVVETWWVLSHAYSLYNFKVAAHNAAGIGPLSDPIVVRPIAVPGSPYPDITPGNGQVRIDIWYHDMYFTHGSPILYYIIYQEGVDVMHTPNTSVVNQRPD